MNATPCTPISSRSTNTWFDIISKKKKKEIGQSSCKSVLLSSWKAKDSIQSILEIISAKAFAIFKVLLLSYLIIFRLYRDHLHKLMASTHYKQSWITCQDLYIWAASFRKVLQPGQQKLFLQHTIEVIRLELSDLVLPVCGQICVAPGSPPHNSPSPLLGWKHSSP